MSNSLIYLDKTYTDEEISSGTLTKQMSLSMTELSVDTMEITVRPFLHLDFFTKEPYAFFTRNKLRFETTEANPLSGDFQQNTPIVQEVDSGRVATWFLRSIDRIGKNVYKLSGFSAVGILTQATHYGGMYGINPQNPDTVTEVVASIFGASTVSSAPRTSVIHYGAYFVYNDVMYCATTNIGKNATISEGTNCVSVISEEFRDVALRGWLPIATARDNLQQVLFAINANLKIDEQGMVHIQNLPPDKSSTITQSNIYQADASVKYNVPVTKVVVVEHQYVDGTERKQLFDGAALGNQLIKFDEPIIKQSLVATGLNIVSSGENYAVVSGTGTLTGIPYIHLTSQREETVSQNATENIIRVDNATLVSMTSSGDIVRRLKEYYSHRNLVNISVANTIVEVGNVVEAFDPYDEVMVDACIENEKINLSHTSKSAISALVGFSPWQAVPYVDGYELFTGTGDWTVPDGVMEITVVLIGGGIKGANGSNGTGSTASNFGDGTKFVQEWAYNQGGDGSVSVSGSASISGSSAGEGGNGGAGGAGGYIRKIVLPVTGNSVIHYSCGRAQNTLSANSHTTATISGVTYSSADGAPNPTGYFDEVSRKTFAKSGTDGLKGGSGGSGGENGGSVSGATGGTGVSSVSTTLTKGLGDRYKVTSAVSIGGVGGGGAGGSSGLVSGSGGTDASATNSSVDCYLTETAGVYGTDKVNGYVANGSAYVYRFVAGNGGKGAAGKAGETYGCGGDGGGGGGGGGATGSASLSATCLCHWNYSGSHIADFCASLSYGAIGRYNQSSGGVGGTGGAGADGCIIFYYREPSE